MKIIMRPNALQTNKSEDPVLPKMKKRDFTIQELREFDGTKGDGRILVAINGKVFDVTKGKHFYGPGKLVCSFMLPTYIHIYISKTVSRQEVFILRLVDTTLHEA